jgi:hypothetical protein
MTSDRPGRLLKLFTKNVLETALNEEMTEHLGHEKNLWGSISLSPALTSSSTPPVRTQCAIGTHRHDADLQRTPRHRVLNGAINEYHRAA